MNRKELQERISYITSHFDSEGPPPSVGDLTRLQIFSTLLLAEKIADLEEALRRKQGGDDVKLLGDDPAQQKLQFEAHGADAIDPTLPREDLNATLSETSPINDHLKVVQGRPEHVGDLAPR